MTPKKDVRKFELINMLHYLQASATNMEIKQ
jgi:hypothetical protein